MATYTEFYCDPVSGSNLNGGSDAGSPSMSDTAGTGSWTSTTNTYVSVATTGSVAVGQFISIYQTGATAPAYVARITAVSGGGGSAWTITVSTTAVAGAKPTTGTTFLAKVGGAWAGPTGTVGFPFTIATLTSLTDASGHQFRCNFKNNGTYSITANIASSSYSGAGVFQGYSTAAGDGGKAVIDGGTSGASYTLFTANCTNQTFLDLVFQNNGATGNATGVTQIGGDNFYWRCVFAHIRGYGMFAQNNVAEFLECESFDCNQANSSTPLGGLNTNVNGIAFRRCVSHDHTAGSNCHGFIVLSSNVLDECISGGNTGKGVHAGTSGFVTILNSTFYNNTVAGIDFAVTSCHAYVENCIFDSNLAYGVDASTGSTVGLIIRNCAFWNNTSGQISTNAGAGIVQGSITLTSSALKAPGSGDFTLNTTIGAGGACLNTGAGTFTQTAAGFSGTTSFPDIGAAQAPASAVAPANPLSLVLTQPTVY